MQGVGVVDAPLDVLLLGSSAHLIVDGVVESDVRGRNLIDEGRVADEAGFGQCVQRVPRDVAVVDDLTLNIRCRAGDEVVERTVGDDKRDLASVAC